MLSFLGEHSSPLKLLAAAFSMEIPSDEGINNNMVVDLVKDGDRRRSSQWINYVCVR
jgi:hypothetical protein